MQYIRRRKIPSFTYSGTDIRKEIFGGYPIKYILIDATADSDFAVEINGVEIINYSINNLNRENAVRYGFDFSTTPGENLYHCILSFEEYNQINNSASIRQLTFVAKEAGTFVLTVVDIINI